jgi:NAD(P)-dependent dehydrogenase (short-subunit alcohol dehydrogenase family)
VLVTTVGINVRKRLADYSDDEFDRVVRVNLRGAFTLIRAFGPAMAARGGGSFIAFSSIRASVVEPGQGIYAATKAGLQQMLRTAAAGGLVGLGGFLVKFLQIALIVIAIAAATAFTIFVLIPALIFACWALLVGIAIAWHTVTDRPWIVEAREHRDAPDVLAWAVVGWAQSRRVIDEVAGAIASGVPPNPAGATRVDIADDRDPAAADHGSAEPEPAGSAGVADPVTG